MLADHVDWPLIYQGMAALVGLIMLATLWASEPPAPAAPPAQPWLRAVRDSVVAPFHDFFQRYAGWLGLGCCVGCCCSLVVL